MSLSSTSTAPAAITALVDVLKARTGLHGVDISDGLPAQITQQMIHCGEVRGTHTIAGARASGIRPRDETFELDVIVEAAWHGDTATQARARVYAMFAELELAVAADPKLGTDFLNSVRIARYSAPRPAPTDEGYAAGLIATLAVAAALRP